MKVSKRKHPSTQKYLAGPIRHAPHREAFIPDIKSWVSRVGWQGYESTPTSEGHTSGATNWVGKAVVILRYSKTKVLWHADLKEVVLVSR
jgi:hypothetical protein